MIFGEVKDGLMILNANGRTAEDELLKTAAIRDRLTLDQYVIMPNHIHFIAVIKDAQPVGVAGKPPATQKSKQLIPLIVHAYKAAVSRKLKFSPWQRSYWDNIIHDEDEYARIYRYIVNNPATWAKDRFYITQ